MDIDDVLTIEAGERETKLKVWARFVGTGCSQRSLGLVITAQQGIIHCVHSFTVPNRVPIHQWMLVESMLGVGGFHTGGLNPG